ncbi:right-handed parallel beta-helix repeat-containing protein [Actinomadura violacea]|uniref:Right-handed parallel beta-helix repeat-containing protein n=1 Tax=Actinomadura violacea TaxID=2819934 RepID=A0ABS3RU85_9ACTN|nr:right-handed parallel beta-helix repeat-containing protein [Actinomadura violacea]MBO2460288.1 right-handed parallel beta-helix repeat-containing protein [Actinomadura violacea]
MRWTTAGSAGLVAVLAGLTPFAPAAPASAQDTAGHRSRTHVVRPGHSIQAAVDRARPGDTIRLLRGTYDGGVLVRKRLTIRGAGDKTVLRPGRKDHCAAVQWAGTGICVIGRAGHPVQGVTVKDLTVRKFAKNGIFGHFTDRLGVEGVLAAHNGEYGISEFNSTRGRFMRNWARDNGDEAGLYVGDIADAHGTVVAGNRSTGNAVGLLVRHARNVKVWGNDLVGNCVGVALVDDSQKGGQGNTTAWKNNISKNNRQCAAHEEVPPLGGTGVLLFGGDHNVIKKNVVKDNRGKLPYSGGIVLFRGTPPLNRPARDNLVLLNVALGNAPFDLVDASGSKSNRFRRNICRTSQPSGLC